MARPNGKDRGLFERPKDSGVWWIRWTDQYGREHREKIGSKSNAQKAYTKRKDEVRRGVKLGPLNRRQILTLDDLLIQYLPEMTKEKSPQGVRAYEKQAVLWRRKFGKHGATELKANDISNFQQQLLKTKAAGTVNRSLTFLRRLYTLAVRDERVPLNPLGSKRLAFSKEPKSRSRYLTENEEVALYRSTSDRKFQLMIQLGVHSGLRRSEQLALRRENVDFERRQAYLETTKADEPQFVRLSSVSIAVLRELLDSHQSEWVFPGKNGPMDGSAVTRRFKRLCEKAGVKDASWHTLRHTYVSRLAMLGVPLPTIMKLARHKSLEMTLRYAHLCPSHEESSLETLATNYNIRLESKISPTGTKSGSAITDQE